MSISSTGVVVRYKPPNHQPVVILTRTVEIEDNHGNTHELNPGDAVLAVDTPAARSPASPTSPPEHCSSICPTINPTAQ
jgi:hypothetical protein